jgi:deaminated glutathione amidase
MSSARASAYRRPQVDASSRRQRVEGLTVAAVQIAPVAGALDRDAVRANLERGVDAVRRCHEATGATLLVLPESATTGYTTGLAKHDLFQLVSEIPGPVTEPLQDVARDLGVTVVWGTYERGRDPDTLYNSAATIGPDGEVLGVYRKTHLYVVEHEASGGWVTPGDDVSVVDTPGARVGTMICFDGDFPELGRVNALLGAEIVVRPSAFLRSADIWELTSRARAYDNHCYVVACNAVGQDPGGAMYFGNSMVVGPTGEVLARATSQPGWVTATLDPDPLRTISPGSSVPQVFDHLADRNLELIRRHRERLEGPARAPFEHAPYHRD